jgi:hypothetical protein
VVAVQRHLSQDLPRGLGGHAPDHGWHGLRANDRPLG